MRTIWKYKLENTDVQYIEMPTDAKLLHVAMQTGDLCLWALVSPQNRPEHVKILIYGTGHPVPDDGVRYIGTAHDRQFIWHVFKG